jgi:NAD(P)-dependent dehydrogenase (short-subunit alcohol dehydrogenase family)
MGLFDFTKTLRHTTYPTIDPSRPELSCRDKTVYITGAGLGSIGSGIALSFAEAGATKIGLMGRTAKSLEATKAKINETYPSVEVHVEIMDQTSNESAGLAAHNVRVAIGAWDVFVNGAAHLPAPTTIAGSGASDWFRPFEVSVKFIQFWATHFLPKARPNATYISLTAGTAAVPAAMMPMNSAYTAAKIAGLKLDEFIALENPSLRVFSLHPGIVDTRMYQKMTEATPMKGKPAPDDISLPSDLCVWLVSGEADFLRGRFMSINFDVEELMARREEIEHDATLMRLQLGGLEVRGPPKMG